MGFKKLMYMRSFKMLPITVQVLDVYNLKATIVIIPKSFELSVNYCRKKKLVIYVQQVNTCEAEIIVSKPYQLFFSFKLIKY